MNKKFLLAFCSALVMSIFSNGVWAATYGTGSFNVSATVAASCDFGSPSSLANLTWSTFWPGEPIVVGVNDLSNTVNATVNCTAGWSYVNLSVPYLGSNDVPPNRAMDDGASPPNLFNYILEAQNTAAPGWVTPWGDGTAGSLVLTLSNTIPIPASSYTALFDYQARITDTNAPLVTGTYSQSVTVNIDYP